MKRLALLITMGVLLSSTLLAQNFFVSGGTRYSVALCASGNVITWGDNTQGQLARKAVNSATVTKESGTASIMYDYVPTSVSLLDPAKNKITVLAVDAGSGGHAIALACDSTVWTWGGNEHGQLGNGYANYGVYKTQCTDLTSVDFTRTQPTYCNQATPQHVLAGETAGLYSGTTGDPYSGILKNVIYVTASTSGSFAIIKDPKTKKTNLLAWGSNKNYAAYCDATGQLGSGATDAGSSYPRYVLDKNKKRLENVIAVDAGDNNCFAIIDDDNDGDPTTGTVYGWGDNTSNKILPNSTTNQVYATPVCIDAAGTKPLTGIKMISAGDGFLLAYDKIGYLYSVGSEWALPTGTPSPTPRANGATAYSNPKEAAKVVAGEEFLYNGGDSYMSNVKGISAGQTSALAMVEITVKGVKSNYVLGWGGAYGSEDKAAGTCTNDLASNDALGSDKPRMAYRYNWRNNKTELIDSVVGISDGDGVMYAIRLEKQMVNGSLVEVRQLYVSGTNGAGQLGFPLTTKGTCVFTRLDLPNCDMGAPCAVADLQPFKICPADTKEMFAGSEGVTTYHYVWQRYDSIGDNTPDGNPGWYELYEATGSSTTNVDNTKWTFDNKGTAAKPIRGKGDLSRYTIDMDGRYKVSIYDTRPIQGCSTCPTVWDTVTIRYATTPIDTTVGEWCGTAISPYTFKYVEPTYSGSTVEKKFVFYGSDVSTKALASLTNSNFTGTSKSATLPINLNTADLEKVSDSVYRVWVADSTRISDKILDRAKAPANVTTSGSLNFDNTTGMATNGYYLFTAYSDFLFKSFDIYVTNYSVPTTLTVTPVLYNAVKSANGYTLGTQLTTLPTTVSVPSSTATLATVNVNTLIDGQSDGRKVYILGLKVKNNTSNGFNMTGPQFKLSSAASDANGMMSLTYANQLESNGEMRVDMSQVQDRVFPFNWVIQKTTMYECGRIPIRFIKNCPPCKDPYRAKAGEKFTITLTGAPASGDVCPGKVITLTTSSVGTDYMDSVVQFAWYKGKPSTTNATPVKVWSTVSKTSTKPGFATYGFTSGTVEADNDWYVVARDNRFPTDTSCMDTAFVKIKEHTIPTYTLGGGGFYCDYLNATSPNITVQLGKVATDTVGKTPWKFYYKFGTATTNTLAVPAAEKGLHTFVNPGAGKFILDSVADKYCSVKATAADTINITKVKLIDSSWVSTKDKFKSCAGSSTPTIEVKATTGASYKWWFMPNKTAATYTTLSNTTATLASPTAGKYYVEFISTASYTKSDGTSASLSCSSTSSVDTVVKYPLPQFTLANGKTYCAGKTVTPISLKIDSDTVLAGNYGAWSVVPTIASAAKPAITIAKNTALASAKTDIGSTEGLYTVVVTNSVTGCSNAGDSKDTANIIINDAIDLSFATPTNFCSGVPPASLDMKSKVTSTASATVFNSGVLSYAFVKSGTTVTDAMYSSAAGASTFTKTTVTTAGTDDTYDLYVKWQKTGEQCAAIASTSITIYANPTVTTALSKTDACLGEAVTLTATNTGSHIGTNSSYDWTASAGTLLGGRTATASVSGATAGTINVDYKLTDDNGCIATATQKVLTVHAKPTLAISATNKLKYCDYDAASQLTATATNLATSAAFTTAGTGTWSCATAATIVSSTGTFTPVALTAPTTTQTYTVKYDYTDMYGCINSATADVVVNAPPVVSITNTKTEFCEYDAAATIAGSPTGGTFTPASVSSGSFDPATLKSASGSPVTVKYEYTDASTTCKSSVTKDFVSWSKPTVTFTPDAITCKETGLVDLSKFVTPSYTATAGKFLNGSVPLIGSSINTADITENTSVTYTYEYTDVHTTASCKNTANGTINVFKPAKPTGDNITSLIKSKANPWVNPEFTAKAITTGATYKWFDRKTKANLASADNTSLDINAAIPTFNFDATGIYEWSLVQYEKTCASDSAVYQLNLFDCDYVSKPKPTNVTKCYDVSMAAADRTVSAVQTNDPVLGQIHWFSTDKPVFSASIVPSTSYTFTQAEIDAIKTGSNPVTMYAFEYNPVKACYGPGIPVTLSINPKPVIDVTVKDLCWNSSKVGINVTPTGGSMKIDNVTVPEIALDPSTLTLDKTKATNTKSVTFDYTSPAGCAAATVTKSINVYYVDPPVPTATSYSYLKNYIDAGTSTPYVEAQIWPAIAANSPVLNWFADPKGSKLNTANELKYNTGLSAETTGTNFLANNSGVFGGLTCYSDTTSVKVIISKCLTPAPTFLTGKQNPQACEGVAIPKIEIDNTSGSFSKFKWYAKNLSDPIAAADNLDKYAPATLPVGTWEVWVTQQASDGLGSTCEGPASKATITINEKPVPAISTATDLCMLAHPTYSLVGSLTNKNTLTGVGTYAARTSSGYKNLNTSNQYSPTYDVASTTSKTTTETVVYTFTTDAGCVDSATQIINTHFVVKPGVPADKSIMRAQITAAIELSTTTKDLGAVINWNSTTAGASSIEPYNTKLTSSTSIDNYTFNATQSLKYGVGANEKTCESEPATTIIKLFDCPVQQPTFTGGQSTMCVYDPNPTNYKAFTGGRSMGGGFVAGTGSKYRVYKKDPFTLSTAEQENTSNYLSSSNEIYQVAANGANADFLLDLPAIGDPKREGNFTFYLVEYDDKYACFGPPAEVKLYVKKRVIPTLTPINPICAEDAALNGSSIIKIENLKSDGTDKVYIYKSKPTDNVKGSPFATITSETYQIQDVTANSYKYWVALDDGCISLPASVDIKINPTPTAPTLTGASTCQTLPATTISATTTDKALWYWSKSKADADVTGANADVVATTTGLSSVTPSVDIANAGTTTFYARVKSTDGCVSPVASVDYIVKPQPAVPQVTVPTAICSNSIATTSASISHATFAAGDKVSIYRGTTDLNVTNYNSYQIVLADVVNGKVSLDVTQTVNGCVSKPGLLSLNVVSNPTQTLTAPSPISCAGSASKPMVVSTIPAENYINWFIDASLTSQVSAGVVATRGVSYTPPVLDQNTTYYIQEVASAFGKECAGPVAAVTYTPVQIPDMPILSATKNHYCEYHVLQTVQATPAPGSATPGFFIWSQSGYVTPKTGTDVYQLRTLNTGSNTVGARYQVTGTNCPSKEATIKITMYENPRIERILNADNNNVVRFCEGQPVVLGAIVTKAQYFDWTIETKPAANGNPAETVTYNAGIFPDTIAEVPAPGDSLKWTLVGRGVYKVGNGSFPCESSPVSGYYKTIQTPHMQIVGDQTYCENTPKSVYEAKILSGELDSLVWKIDASRKWTYLYGADKATRGEKDSLGRFIQMNWVQPGIDTLRVASYYTKYKLSCVDTTKLVVRVAKKPDIQFTYDIPGFGTEVRFLNQTTQDSVRDVMIDPTTKKLVNVTFPVKNSYSWDFGRPSDSKDITFTYLQDSVQRKKGTLKVPYEFGYYTVTLTANSDEYGCRAQDTIEIFVDIQKGLYMPNSMVVPGVGGHSDINKFTVKGFNVRSYKVTIYDQWGNILWSSSKLVDHRPAEGWDGTYKGEFVKEDVYIWNIEAEFEDGTKWEGPKYGNIMLLRN